LSFKRTEFLVSYSGQRHCVKKTLSIFLNLYLGLFIISGIISAVDDSLVLFCGVYILTAISAIFSFFAALAAPVVYILMGFTRMIPRRVFLPVTLFYLAGFLAMFLLAIYGGGDWASLGWKWDLGMSLCQAVLGLTMVCYLQGGWKIGWPLMPQKYLSDEAFSWKTPAMFALGNVFILAPAIAIYLVLCGSLAIGHFTGGFLTVHPSGLKVQVRQYMRSDGKEVELVPMAHVADAAFYREISQSFPTNSIILMEGVTDRHNLLTNGISYKRMARSLGLAEQKKEFKPRGEIIDADVDVDEFTTNTIHLLNLVMLFHTKGMNADTVMKLALYSPPPDVQRQLLDDLIRKRNNHLLEKFRSELSEPGMIIIPWGAGHMPGIAEAIQKDGFHLTGTKDYTIIRFFR
jgi:hypothetical protein